MNDNYRPCAQLSGSVSIGFSCWIGPNRSIINQVMIGNNVTVGISSVVIKIIKDNVKVIGLYALPLKEFVGFSKKNAFYKLNFISEYSIHLF